MGDDGIPDRGRTDWLRAEGRLRSKRRRLPALLLRQGPQGAHRRPGVDERPVRHGVGAVREPPCWFESRPGWYGQGRLARRPLRVDIAVRQQLEQDLRVRDVTQDEGPRRYLLPD